MQWPCASLPGWHCTKTAQQTELDPAAKATSAYPAVLQRNSGISIPKWRFPIEPWHDCHQFITPATASTLCTAQQVSCILHAVAHLWQLILQTLHAQHAKQGYVTVRCPSICSSVCPIRQLQHRVAVAAVGPAGKRYQSIAARLARQQQGSAARHTAANAGSGMFTAEWRRKITQTCVNTRHNINTCNILAKPRGPILIVCIEEEFQRVVLQVRLGNDLILHRFNILQLLLRLSQPLHNSGQVLWH